MSTLQLNGFELTAADFSRPGPIVKQALANLPEQEQEAIISFLQQWFDTDLEVITARTSGSTGPPKTIKLHKSQMLASAALTAGFFNFKAGQRVLLPLSARYIAGKMMLVRAIYAGLQLDIVDAHFQPSALSGEKVYDFAVMVPAQLVRVMEQQELSHFRQILLGGADLPAVLLPMLKVVKVPVYQGFGMTETVSHIALRRVNGIHPEHFYTTLEGVEIAVDDNQCLRICAAATAGNWLQTNDVVNLLNDRQFSWLGRYDHVVNSGGIKVVLEEVEAALADLIRTDPALDCLQGREFALSRMPDPRFGESIALWITGAVPSEDERVKCLRLLKEKLPLAWAPRAILSLSKLPLLENGKLNRRELEQKS